MSDEPKAYANDDALGIIAESADDIEAVAACLDCLADSDVFAHLRADMRGRVLRVLAGALRAAVEPMDGICPAPEP